MKTILQLNTCPERSRRELKKLKELFTSFLFYLSILFFIIGFQFSDTMLNGWYQQFMPNLNGAPLSDITFVDSLNGFATTLYRTGNDSAYMLKTTDSGDNWSVNYVFNYPFYRIQFINTDTGYALSFQRLFKTTNRGINWQIINIALSTAFVDMYVLNSDTIWAVASEGLFGGIFLTPNGGASWTPQANFGSANPDRIYMYNRNIGYANRNGGSFMYWTSNGGQNWTPVPGVDGFTDIYFIDSLTGWKAFGTMKKTTNGGFNWVTQTLPQGGIILTSQILRFTKISRDTIWGGGSEAFYGAGQFRGILNRTTNGGGNWLFQIPDTSIHSGVYGKIQFINQKNGWAYWSNSGIHTTTGGDTTFYTGIQQIVNAVPEKFILKQNYPNPFNPRTVIPYSVSSPAYVRLIAYDITGREVQKMVDRKQDAGEYEVDFMGKFTSTGVYFYRMTVTEEISNQIYSDTKKMILLK